jgi:bisphosphoglycerate-independent phosphoglycerate mutase (AlkP superfamily)
MGYEVFVTADHGMNAEGHHGGTNSVERNVAFHYFGDGAAPEEECVLDQLTVAPTILARIGLPIPDTMRSPVLFR